MFGSLRREPEIRYQTKIEQVTQEADPALFQCAPPPRPPVNALVKSAPNPPSSAAAEFDGELWLAFEDCFCTVNRNGGLLAGVEALPGCENKTATSPSSLFRGTL